MSLPTRTRLNRLRPIHRLLRSPIDSMNLSRCRLRNLAAPLAAIAVGLAPLVAAAQEPGPQDAAALDAALKEAAPREEPMAQLLVADPALVRGDSITWQGRLMDAIQADPSNPLCELAAPLASQHSEDGLSPADLAARGDLLSSLAAEVESPEASLALRRGVHANARARRYGPQPASLPADLYPEFIQSWLVMGPLGALDERMPQTAPVPALSERPGPASPEPPSDLGAGDTWRIPGTVLAADGKERTWQAVERTPNQASARWRSLVHPDGGLTYALALLAPAAPDPSQGEVNGPLTLEIRTGDPVRAWWNGVLAIDAPRLSPLDRPNVLRVRVTPRAEGWNQLLLRLSTKEATPLSVRFLQETDGVSRAVTMRQPRGGAMPPGNWEGIDCTLQAASAVEPVADSLANKLRALEGLPFAGALKLFQANLAGRPDVALAQARPAGAGPEELAAWLRQRLIAVRGALHFPGELRRRLALEIIDELKGLDALGKVGYEYEVSRLLREDQPAAALEMAEAWLAAAPDVAAAKLWRVRALVRLDRSGLMALRALETLVEEEPYHADARMALVARLSGEDESALSAEHAWAALRADASKTTPLDKVLDAFEVSGDPRLEEVLAAARRWEEAHPSPSVAPGELRNILGRAGRFTELLSLQEAHANAHPLSGSAWWTLGNARMRLGDEAGAKRAFERELALNPSDETTRQLLARFGSADPAEAFFEAFAPDTAAALQAASLAEKASVVEALDSGLVYFFPDGSMHARYQTLTQPQNRSGAEELNAVPVREGTRSIRILKESGDVQEPVDVNGEWVLPALEPGDVIDTVWDRIEPGIPGTAPMGQLWRFASFERAFPTSRWVLFVPDGLPGELKLLRFEGTHEKVAYEGGIAHVLTASHPQFQPEPLQPTDVELLPIATLGADRDRQDELRSWWSYAARNTTIPADLEGELFAFIEEAMDGVDPADGPADDAARAKALYDAVDGYLQSFEGDENAPSVWLTKKGWPAFLLGALYERAAIPYRWAVLKSGLAPELEPPSPAVFEGIASLAQIVLRLETLDEAGDPIWIVHSGRPGTPFGALQTQAAGALAWVLDGPDGTAHEEALPRSQADNHWNLDLSVEYVLREDGSADVAGRLTDASPGGMMLIQQIREATAQQRESFAKSQAAQFAPGVDLVESRIVLDGSEGEGMVLLFGGRASEFATQRGDESVAAIPFVPLQLDRAFGPAERRWPLAMRQVTRLRVRIHIDPGTGWTLLDAPQPVDVTEPGLEVALEVFDDPDGGRTYEQRFLQRGLMLEAAALPEFLQRMGKMEQEYRRPLRLKKRGS